MGSLFSKPKVVEPPAPVYNTYRDEVNKVEQVPVKQADGTVVYITRPIALSAAEQAEKDKLDKIKSEALAEVQRLSDANAGLDESSKALAESYVAQQQKVLDTALVNRGRSEEVALAKRGLADSAAALAVRRARSKDALDAQQNLTNSKAVLLNEMRGQQLSLQQNLYNIANSNLKADAAQKYQAATSAMSRSIGADVSRQASILSYYGRMNDENSAFSSAFGTGLGGTIGRSIGGVFGGGAGATAGGLLGSWIWRR